MSAENPFGPRPDTFEGAVDALLGIAALRAQIHKAFDGETGPESLAGLSHHTLGRALRNAWRLHFPESAALKADTWANLKPERQAKIREHYARVAPDAPPHEGANMHGDDVSGAILGEVFARAWREWESK